MQHYNQPAPNPLGELEMQQALNIQTIIQGAQIAAMYLDEGQTLNDIDTDMILEDLQAVVSGNY